MKTDDLRREFDWFLQNHLRISAPVLKRTVSEWTRFFPSCSPEAKNRFHALESSYSIEHWPRFCTGPELQLSLFYLDLLDQHLTERIPKSLSHALDIGCKNWSYLPTLQAFRPGHWHGIELDGHRRDISLTTRRGYGDYMAKHFSPATYQVGSLLELSGSYSFITWFLPFVIPYPQTLQQIPDRFFQPQALLAKTWQLLAPNGLAFILNQGEQEVEAQRKLLQTLAINAKFLGEMTSPFNPFDQPRFAWLLEKESAT